MVLASPAASVRLMINLRHHLQAVPPLPPAAAATRSHLALMEPHPLPALLPALSPSSWQLLGRIEWQLGNVARARAVLERGSAVASPCAPLLACWAKLEAQAGNRARARQLMERSMMAGGQGQAARPRPGTAAGQQSQQQRREDGGGMFVPSGTGAASDTGQGEPSAAAAAATGEGAAGSTVATGRSAMVEAAAGLQPLPAVHLPALQAAAVLEDRAGNAALAARLYEQALAEARTVPDKAKVRAVGVCGGCGGQACPSPVVGAVALQLQGQGCHCSTVACRPGITVDRGFWGAV